MSTAKVAPSENEDDDDETEDRYYQEKQQAWQRAREKDIKDSYKNMFVLLKQLVGMCVISLVIVILIIVLRTAITVKCRANPVLVFPAFWLHALADYGGILLCALFFVYFFICLLLPRLLWPTKCEIAMMCCPTPFACSIAGWFVLKFVQDPSKSAYLRFSCVAISAATFFSIYHRKARRTRRPSANYDSQMVFSKHHVQSVKQCFWTGLLFSIGYYVFLYFTTNLSPHVTHAVRSKFGEDSILVVAAEFTFIIAFFSILLPLWSKAFSRACLRSALLCFFDENSRKCYSWNSLFGRESRSYSLTCIEAERRHPFFEPEGINLSSQQSELRVENVVLRLMVFVNFAIDVMRYVYGRGMISNMSRVDMLLLLISKDICYQTWHFGFKYVDWTLVFTLKIFHGGLGKKWRIIERVVKLFVNVFGIPKYICSCWELPVDYAALKGREGETTDCAVKLHFSNTTIVLVNLPDSFNDDILRNRELQLDKDYLEIMKQADELNIEHIVECGSSWDTRRHRKPRRKNAKKNTKAAGKKAFHREEAKNTSAKIVDPASRKVRSVLDVIHEGVLVTEDETENFKEVVSIVQSQIFFRYQVRAAAKFFSSILLLFVPLATRFTASKDHVRFEEFDLFGDGEISSRYRISAIAFLAVDVIEWAGMTYFLLHHGENAATKIQYLSEILACRQTLVVMGVISVLFGICLFETKWDPFDLSYINRKMGHSADDAWDWPQVYDKCF